jgi:hypothetical protein
MTPGPTIKQGVAQTTPDDPSINGHGSGHVTLLSQGTGVGHGVM